MITGEKHAFSTALWWCRENACASACISISRIYFSFMRILPAGGANCRCPTRLVQEERCFIRAYRMCIVHPVRTDECDNTHERAVLSDKLLTRITMSRTIHVVPIPHTFTFFIACAIFETIRTRLTEFSVLRFDLLMKISSSEKLINKIMVENYDFNFYFMCNFFEEIKNTNYTYKLFFSYSLEFFSKQSICF